MKSERANGAQLRFAIYCQTVKSQPEIEAEAEKKARGWLKMAALVVLVHVYFGVINSCASSNCTW
jgi:hypothetical protein